MDQKRGIDPCIKRIIAQYDDLLSVYVKQFRSVKMVDMLLRRPGYYGHFTPGKIKSLWSIFMDLI